MNLYAISPTYAPCSDGLTFELAETDEKALEQAVYNAADDAVRGYGSPRAQVYLIARNVQLIGEASAIDAPKAWAWAHPGVEENAVMEAEFEAQVNARSAP